MTDMETQLRSALEDLADQARPTPLLGRLEQEHHHSVRRYRLTIAAVAAAAAAAVAAGSLVVLRMDQPRIVEPVVRPPKVFSLSEVTSSSPGRSDVVVSLSNVDGEASAHLLPAGSNETVQLPGSDLVPSSFTESISADGTRFIRQNDRYINPFIEIVDLRTGRRDDLGGVRGYCPELSPDNRTVALFSDGGVQLVDVRTRTMQTLGPPARGPEPCGGGLGWSPDGDLLMIRSAEGARVVDRAGEVILRVPSAFPANGSMSWSPDGRSVLLYDRNNSRFVAVDVAGGGTTHLPPPSAGDRPVGWAGSRVVWLTGDYGDQSLVMTDPDGANAETWMRFDVGDRAIECVEWSVRLRGKLEH